MKLEFKNTEEELAYYEEVLETLPQYPTPLLNHAMGLVKFRISKLNVQKGSESFKFDMVTGKWYFGFNQESSTTRLYHTKEDLVNAGFEWMFSCPGFNVEEVE